MKVPILLLLAALAALAAATPLTDEGYIKSQEAEYAASMAMYRMDDEAQEVHEVQQSKEEPKHQADDVASGAAHEDETPADKQTSESTPGSAVVTAVNNLLASVGLGPINPVPVNPQNFTAMLTNAITTATQTIVAQIGNPGALQSVVTGLNNLNSVAAALINRPTIDRPGSSGQSSGLSASSQASVGGFKTTPEEQESNGKNQQIHPKSGRPFYYFHRRPEYFYPSYYHGAPFHPQYYNPYHYHHNSYPYFFRSEHAAATAAAATAAAVNQFRRPADPTSDESLSDLEALRQLEELIQRSGDGYPFIGDQHAEARGLLSSLSTGANAVRSGFKNIIQSVSAHLPTVVYKTLVVPSLALGTVGTVGSASSDSSITEGAESSSS